LLEWTLICELLEIGALEYCLPVMIGEVTEQTQADGRFITNLFATGIIKDLPAVVCEKVVDFVTQLLEDNGKTPSKDLRTRTVRGTVETITKALGVLTWDITSSHGGGGGRSSAHSREEWKRSVYTEIVKQSMKCVEQAEAEGKSKVTPDPSPADERVEVAAARPAGGVRDAAAVLGWSAEDVANYVGGLTEDLGERASEYSDGLKREEINGKAFVELSNDDLKELGVDKMGHRKVLLSKIALLKAAVSSGGSGRTQPTESASVTVTSEEAGAGEGAKEMAEERTKTVLDSGMYPGSPGKAGAKDTDPQGAAPPVEDRVDRELPELVMEEHADHETESEGAALEKWDTLGAARTAQLLEAATRTGQRALNTSRLNIVGEGRAGKTAWLRGVSNQRFTETDSTIGVQQSLLEVNKVDIKAGGGGGWSVVRDGSSSIMTAEEAEKRLAAELALAETPEERREREKRAQEEADKIKVSPSSIIFLVQAVYVY